MIKLIDTEKVKLTCNRLPEPYARCISPLDSEELKKDKTEFPFKNKVHVDFNIRTQDKSFIFLFEDYKNDKEGFKYNGSNIPKPLWAIVGSNADPQFLIASYFHDIFCDDKSSIGYDRYLSSLIFKELLISCGVSKFKAQLMFIAVDNYQKLFGKWRKDDK